MIGVQEMRFGLIIFCLLMGYANLSMLQAQPNPDPKARAEESANKLRYAGYSLEQLKVIEPTSPNPYLSFLPVDVKPDKAYWRAWMRAKAIERRAVHTQTIGGPASEESEPNDSVGTGNALTSFGSGPEQTPSADVSGNFPPPSAATAIASFEEDDGAIPLANDVRLSAGQRVTVMAQIGDGPHGVFGTANGDFDFYAISGVTAGQIITAQINTPPDIQVLDSFLALWNGDGNLLATNDDDFSRAFSLDSFLLYTAPADGTYYISVGSIEATVPTDPFDSSTGSGIVAEGPYELAFGLDAYDVDVFTVMLNAGDILNVNGLGAITHVSLLDAAGVELITSNFDYTPILPAGAPFSGGGNPALLYLIHQSGTYGVRVTSHRAGYYLAELRTARPPLETAEPGVKQVLFIDFDGAVADLSRVTGELGIRRFLSPLRAFLGNWGLEPSDEDAVIDVVLAVVEENLHTDILANGDNPRFDMEIRNSRDHDDPFGEPHVSRVIVGGTIAEFGMSTIGIAESIDVGNFDTTETAFVLLDILSDTTGEERSSINQFSVEPSASLIDLIGVAVGNIVAHEAGHLFGNFHTEPSNASGNIMDRGGHPANTFGVGPDNIFGTEDDVDVDFGLDSYAQEEGLVGLEHTLNVIAFGLSSMPHDLMSTDPLVSTGAPHVTSALRHGRGQ
jgi:hypothetical protein